MSIRASDKGCIIRLTAALAALRLADPQPLSRQALAPVTGEPALWAVEHASSSSGMASGLRALYMFMMAKPERRRLLLGSTAPRYDTSRQLTRRYHPSNDEVLLPARQSQDCYLIVGTPGAGKTYMPMRMLVE